MTVDPRRRFSVLRTNPRRHPSSDATPRGADPDLSFVVGALGALAHLAAAGLVEVRRLVRAGDVDGQDDQAVLLARAG